MSYCTHHIYFMHLPLITHAPSYFFFHFYPSYLNFIFLVFLKNKNILEL